MKGIKWFFFSVFVALLFVCQSSFALPFSITPAGTLPTTVDNVSDAIAYYTVRNTTTQPASASFVKFLPPFVKQVVDNAQPTFCSAVFNLAPNASCTLALNVSGPVNPRDPNPEHHLFVCRAGGKTCAGTASELNVTQITLVSITVTPSSPADLPIGATQQFVATGTFSNGSTRVITTNVTWNSSAAFASINATGLATGVSVGTTQITASFGSVTSAAVNLNVVAAAVTSITVTPNPATVASIGSCGVGTQGANCLAFTAMATFTNGTTSDITQTAMWASSNNLTVASISNAGGACPGSTCTGTAFGLNPGTTSITATRDSVVSPAVTLTVANVLLSITVTPNPMFIYVGENFQFTATGNYNTGSSAVITDSATWASTNPAFASVDNIINPGLATGLAPGVTNITATSDSITGSSSLTVNDQKIYAGLNNTNVCMSTNGGSTWPPANCAIPIASRPVLDMAPAEGRIYTLVSSLGLLPGRVCYTDNGSIVWTCPAAMNVVVPAALAALSLTYVYASEFSLAPEVCVSTDNGVTFSGGCAIVVADATDSVTSLAVTDITNLYAGTQKGLVCKSSDNGGSWTLCVTPPGATSVNALTVDRSTGYIYAGVTSGANGGVCVSTNGGTTYACNTTGFTGDPVLSVAESNGYLYAGTTLGNVCVSINNGLTFTCKPVFGSATNITNLAIDRYGLVFAGSGAGANPGEVCQSYDHGITTPWPICQIVNALSPVTGLAITQP